MTNELKSAIAHAVGVFTGTNIPEPIKRNFFKVRATAAIEIPIAYMKGIACSVSTVYISIS